MSVYQKVVQENGQNSCVALATVKPITPSISPAVIIISGIMSSNGTSNSIPEMLHPRFPRMIGGDPFSFRMKTFQGGHRWTLPRKASYHSEILSPGATIEISIIHFDKLQGPVKPRNKWCSIDQHGRTGSSVV